MVRRDDFEAPFAAMVHDFLVTRNYALFPILPLTGSLERAMQRRPAASPGSRTRARTSASWRRDADVSTIRWFTTEPCYVFHPMNAWEEGDKIFADVMEYPVAPLFPNARRLDAATTTVARLVRWTFDLAGRLRTQSSASRSTTWPASSRASTSAAPGSPIATAGSRASPRGRRRRSASTPSPTSTCRPASARPRLSPAGDSPGEPVFVPRTADAAEGDGWLVAVVYRGAEDRSDFVVFDAQDVAAGPIATAKVPRRVPFGFHGNWRAA